MKETTENDSKEEIAEKEKPATRAEENLNLAWEITQVRVCPKLTKK